jgi:3-oxoacyl-[acyl-carrier-protein] synthase II
VSDLTYERVLVTGVGVISPLALSTREHFERYLRGDSSVSISSKPVYKKYTPQLEARVQGYRRRSFITNRMLRKLLSPSAGMAVGAAGEAIADAGLTDEKEVLEKCGLYMGSLSLEIETDQFIDPLRASLRKDGMFDISLFATRGMKILDPLFMVKALPNAGLCGVSVQHQVLGPNTNLTNGITSGLMAVGLAIEAIRRGEADCALAGGYDTLLGMDSVAENVINGRLSRYYEDPSRACRPFDRARDGFALGEGAAFVFLESETHALSRGAKRYAEIFPCRQTTDTNLLRRESVPDGTGLEQAARQALSAATCEVEELGVIFGDGLGTEKDDIREARALQGLLGAIETPITAGTCAIGFTGAASGVFSLIHGVMAIHDQVVPSLWNCEDPDPRCPIHFISQPEQKQYQRSLVWNSDYGIKNVAVVLGAVSS